MKINIYYGGRGLMDDPSLYVIDKMQSVLEELNVTVERFMLSEQKNSITTLPQTLKSADGIILATTVEWFGIGGFLQSFLDACWLYGDKEKISQIFMCPVVMSTTFGERQAKLDLATAWEILGGKPCSGLCGYIPDTGIFDTHSAYVEIIEKKTENMYRTIRQQTECLPASNKAVTQTIAINRNVNLTPQESEQLSQYAADESYVQTQKEDIKELASLFKGILEQDEHEDDNIAKAFASHFVPQAGVEITYKITVSGKKQPLFLSVKGDSAQCDFKDDGPADITISTDKNTLLDVTHGNMTFQRAFMSLGTMKMKGDFAQFRMIDQLFKFMD